MVLSQRIALSYFGGGGGLNFLFGWVLFWCICLTGFFSGQDYFGQLLGIYLYFNKDF